MGWFDEINKVLRVIDSKNPGYVDTLNDNDINNIPEVKKLLKGFKIVNFSVKRDNEKQGLGDGTKKNAGGNKLREFNYTIEPDI